MRAGFKIAALALLTACAPLADTGQVGRLAPATIDLPPMKLPAGRAAAPTKRSNASIAQEFMALSFQLESGRRLPVLTRFEGPISIRVTGIRTGPATGRDLDLLLARLRNEARIPITRVNPDQPANITIQFLSRATLRRAVPQAACFVAPGVDSWAAFRSRRNAEGRDWAALTTRTRMAVFIPGDVSAQEVRDCLQEEIAQALGPVNDLYYLTDSVFNDDNFHTILTGFDMMILRLYYDAELRSGMTPQTVAGLLPRILNRINPRGRGGGTAGLTITPNAWINEIETALGARGAGSVQLAAAKRAVQFAKDSGWNDNRLGFSLYALGRLALGQNSNLALNSFAEADAIFRANPDTELHAAHVAVQSAAFALSGGRPKAAIEIADENTAIALRAENPSLLSTLLMIKAAALDADGRAAQAEIVRRDALGWARYGLTTSTEIRARLTEIAALAPPLDKETRQ